MSDFFMVCIAERLLALRLIGDVVLVSTEFHTAREAAEGRLWQ
jgi:hypothetical protein